MGDTGTVVTLIVMNGLCALLAKGLLSVTAYMIADVRTAVINKEEVIEALNLVSFNGYLKFGNVASKLWFFNIWIGVPVVVFLGAICFGGHCKGRCLLVTYALIVLVFFIVGITGVALWFTMQNKVENTMEAELLMSMNNYEGYTSSNKISIGWDLLFIGFDCCGINSIESNKNQFDSTNWTIPAGDFIPYSCCESATEDNYKNISAGSGESTCTTLTSGYQKTGCYQAFKQFWLKFEAAVIGLGMVLIIIELIAIIFACVMCYKDNNEIE